MSRSLADFAQLIGTAERQGRAVVALDVGVDMTTPVGELVAGVMASVAQWERRMIAPRTREAVHQQRGNVARLAPSDVHGRIVGLAADGMNAAAIARLLDAEEVPTPNGGLCWYPSTVRRMIASARLQGLVA